MSSAGQVRVAADHRVQNDDVSLRELIRELHDVAVAVFDALIEAAAMGLLASCGEVLAGRVDIDGSTRPGVQQREVDGADACPDVDHERPVDTVGEDDVDQLLRGPMRTAGSKRREVASPHRVRRIR